MLLLRRVLCAVAVLAVGVGSGASGGAKVIGDVPSYPYYKGCGPTAAGMVIGYWDAHGFSNLIPGSNSWVANEQAIKDMIVSPEHIADYWGTDRVPPPPLHADNCVADFCRASRDPLADGFSYFGFQQDGLRGYAEYCGYVGSTASFLTYWDGLWARFLGEIDAGRPMEMFVDSDADGTANHFVTGIGYDDTGATRKYACYDGSAPGIQWQDVQWYTFAENANGQPFGIYGLTLFEPVPEPATMTLLAIGAACLLRRRHRRLMGI